MDFLSHLLLFTGMLVGVVLIPFGLPGAAVVLLAVFVYALATDFSAEIGMGFFIILCVLTVIAETADNWLTAVGARRYGASRSSMWLSFLGGLAGAVIIGGPLAFVFGPLGPVAGGFAGAFAVVFVNEYYKRGDAQDALRAAWGTFLGRMAGIVLKLVIAVAMIIAVAVAIVF
jgi:uncharacterized protein YqgC (DUF456 family)